MIVFLKNIPIEGPGNIETFFKATSWDVKTIELAKGKKLPSTFSQIEAIIVLGGPMNVYEERKYPFLKEENKFLKKALKLEIPLIGICLGAQLLAKASGARVKKAVREEIGWCNIDLNKKGKKDPLFAGLKQRLKVFQWHEDQFDIPKKGYRLAKSNICPNQAFRIGKNAYGLQFHFEVTPFMIVDWMKEYIQDKETKNIDEKKILIDTLNNVDEFNKLGYMIMYNFSKIISKHRQK